MLRADHSDYFPEASNGQFNGQDQIRIIGDHYDLVKFIVHAVQHQICCQIDVRSFLLGPENANGLGWTIVT